MATPFSKGTKRRIQTVMPVQAVIGDLGSKSDGRIKSPTRYGEKAKYVGYQKSWGPANRFMVRTKNGSALEDIDPTKQAAVRAQRLKFKTVHTNALDRYVDPNKRQQDQLAFSKQTKYGTLLGYLFHLEWEAYE